MSDLSSRAGSSPHALNQDAPEGSWQSLLGVLDGAVRLQASTEVVKLVSEITARPCDLAISPGRFEAWFGSRPHHAPYPFELAAPALHYIMRLVGLSRVLEPQVGVIERARLGTPFPDHEARAIWIVPAADAGVSESEQKVEISIREAPSARARTGLPVPPHGVWSLPTPFPRNQGVFVAASFPCPRCGVQPAQFQELVEEGAFLCPECGQSFVPRISRF